jgi:hypothetical protein
MQPQLKICTCNELPYRSNQSVDLITPLQRKSFFLSPADDKSLFFIGKVSNFATQELLRMQINGRSESEMLVETRHQVIITRKPLFVYLPPFLAFGSSASIYVHNTGTNETVILSVLLTGDQAASSVQGPSYACASNRIFTWGTTVSQIIPTPSRSRSYHFHTLLDRRHSAQAVFSQIASSDTIRTRVITFRR